MLCFVLAASLAAAPAPRAASAPETLIHIPRMDALQGLTAFLERAGQPAAMLRPDVWFAELHPFLSLDPRQPDTLTRAGIDPASPLTLSLLPSGRISCTRLADPKLFQERAAAMLQTANPKLTEVKATTSAGLTSVLVPRDSGGDIGYALKGKEACAFASVSGGFVDDGQGKVLFKEASRLVGQTPKADARMGKLPGSLYVSIPKRGLTVGLDGSATALQVEGTGMNLPLPAFQSSGTSPYGTVMPTGLLFSRARLSPAGMSDAMDHVRALLQQVCPACPQAELSSITRAVSGRLTGNVLLAVDGVRPRPNLRTPDGRFFASRQALVAEVKDPAAVKSALAPLAKFPGARVLEEGYALDLKGGTLLLRLQGRHLALGNDETVASSLLSVVPTQGAKLPHAVTFTVDPARVASGLKQVSLMDVVADKSLAGIFTVGLELGPLLSRSKDIEGWLDSLPGGGHRFSSRWTLPATP
ncbi:hypothetical protein D187_004711 [Cystobacter fuscus DSM 2262]|uniref:Uncharacterized protein n=1 Tax=Cystobacter fuscus (strain ATCC 25194 / DSM 2262 / NBRC 100088 / M29) TaxID=1242864 RepID=S9P6H6_CYSF2|nr:hypothetical protein [Cystobacter fuscus]EPX57832.1 hypothetical protein D187_004711 [Cystobacter fuscus DSM 2262]